MACCSGKSLNIRGTLSSTEFERLTTDLPDGEASTGKLEVIVTEPSETGDLLGDEPFLVGLTVDDCFRFCAFRRTALV